MRLSSRAVIIFGAVVLAFFVAGFALFSPHKTQDIANAHSQGADIIAFGDSLISGYGASKGGGLVADLSKKLGKPIINLGHSGDTTAAALARVDEIDRYHPKVVIVLLGGNDALRGVPVDTTFSNLAKIVAHIQSDGAAVLLLGVRGGIPTDPYAAKFSTLSQNYRTGYVPDVLSGLLGEKEYMYDAVHPNDAGYAKIAERVYPALLPLAR